MTRLETIKTPEALLDAGLIETEALESLRAVTQRYALAITPTMAALVDNRDPQDPIARQFVPDAAELVHLPRSGTIRLAMMPIVPSMASFTVIPTGFF